MVGGSELGFCDSSIVWALETLAVIGAAPPELAELDDDPEADAAGAGEAVAIAGAATGAALIEEETAGAVDTAGFVFDELEDFS